MKISEMTNKELKDTYLEYDYLVNLAKDGADVLVLGMLKYYMH